MSFQTLRPEWIFVEVSKFKSVLLSHSHTCWGRREENVSLGLLQMRQCRLGQHEVGLQVDVVAEVKVLGSDVPDGAWPSAARVAYQNVQA